MTGRSRRRYGIPEELGTRLSREGAEWVSGIRTREPALRAASRMGAARPRLVPVSRVVATYP